MTIRRLAILLPCHSLEDFPVHYRGAEADDLLTAWTVLWHPLLIAAAGQAPTWYRADSPPDDLAGAIVAIPGVATSHLPTGFCARARDQGAILLRGGTREAMLEVALAQTDCATSVQPGVPAELVADFHALGYCYLQVQLLTRRMRYVSNLDEAHFGQQVVRAAQAAVAEDLTTAGESLGYAFNLLSQERDHYYSVDVYLLDLTLTAPSTLGEPLCRELQTPEPINVLLSGATLEQMASQFPQTLQILRQALQEKRCCLVGGSAQEQPWPLMEFESVAADLREGIATFQKVLGTRPEVFGRWRSGLTPLVPQLLQKSGFMAALHLTLDGNRVPQGSQAKTRWEGLDGSAIDALARAVLDASEPGVFLDLALRLGETMDMDHVATLCLAHWPGHACRWYDELRRVSRHTPALGRFYRLDAYFRDTMLAGRLDRFEASQYRADYLKPAVIRQRADVISRSVRYWQNVALRRAAEAFGCWASLLGKSHRESLPPVGTVDEPAPRSDLEAAFQQTQRLLVDALQRGEGQLPRRLMLLNPWTATQRLAILPQDSAAQADAAGGPGSGDRTAMQPTVVEVPGCGFSLVPLPSPTPKKISRWRQPKNVASEQRLRTRYYEAHIHPETGGLLSIRSYRARGNLLSQQLALRTTNLGSPNPGSKAAGPGADAATDQPSYTRMIARQIRVIESDPTHGIIESEGILQDAQGETVASFRQTFRAVESIPLLLLDIELDVVRQPRPDPWNSYYACRFAWGDDMALVSRSLHETRQRADVGRWEAPHYIEIDTGHARVSILTGGLPFHRLLEGRFLDSLLIVRGETARRFRLAIAVDLAHPIVEAWQLLLADTLCSHWVSMPEQISSRWLFHLGKRNLVATSWQAILEQGRPRGFRVGLLETAGTATRTTLAAFRPIASACLLDLRDQPCGDLTVEQGNVVLDIAPYEWIRLEAAFSEP